MNDNHLHGIGFLVGGMYLLNLLSSFMSSPWTIANVGADELHASTARKLILLSVLMGLGAGAIAAYEDKNRWTLYGAAATGAASVAVYAWALTQAQARGYQGLNQGMSQGGQ